MNDMVSSIVDLVIDEGLDDWVALSIVQSHCVQASKRSGADIEALVFATVGKLIDDGLARPGDLGGPDDFTEWDLTAEQTIARLRKDAERLGWGADLGYSCWFSNTKAGDERARKNREGERRQGF